jgi:hypothetical protein
MTETTEIIEHLGGNTGSAYLCWIPLMLPFCIAGLVIIIVTGIYIYDNRQNQSRRPEERDIR